MNESPPRLGAKLAVLAALWIFVFWLTPSPEGRPARVADASMLTRPAEVAPESAGEAESPIVDPLPASAEALPDPEPARAGVSPPPFTLYTVRPEDTIEIIAAREFGDPSSWRAIAQMNPGVDPIRLRAGEQIRIPSDLSNIQGVVTGDTPPPSAPPELIYVVARNDTLTEISQKVYGRSIHWRRIQQANASIVNAEGTNLRPGMELRIPTLPAEPQD